MGYDGILTNRSLFKTTPWQYWDDFELKEKEQYWNFYIELELGKVQRLCQT